MRQITAAEVKPGMEVQFDLSGWDVKGTVGSAAVSPHGVWIYTEDRCEMSLDLDAPVTVLSEPQPAEPTAFGARVVAGGCQFVLVNTALHQWSDITGLWNPWREVCARGPVTVIPDQGWTVPADTPEVPDRIEEWGAWDDVPEGVVVTVPGLFCHYRKNQGVIEFSDPDDDPEWTEPGVRAMPRGYGPWTRVTDA